VELGEAPLDALVRELTEELGVLITRPAGPPLASLHPLAHEPSFELAIWVVTAWEGSVTNCAPAEHDELGWFDAEEWSALSLAHQEYRAVLASAMANAREASRA
jgi:8-oxo-dGTP pyrophosphatase MutT (NUDIX family)